MDERISASLPVRLMITIGAIIFAVTLAMAIVVIIV
jgi:hypothetical protein